MALLELFETKVRQGDFTLRVTQLSLQPGRLYTLQGRNGAGKSTLLRQLALLQKPEEGRMLFAGEPVSWRNGRLKPLRQQITLLEQNPLLFSGSVEKNLAFGLKLRGYSGAALNTRIDEALDIVGLNGFQQRQSKELSGGETRRVALSRALCLQPKLLLLDEPTANLDAGQVAAFERFLVGLPERGMTMVIASHDTHQQQRLGGEIISLQNGRIEQAPSTDNHTTYQPLLKQVNG